MSLSWRSQLRIALSPGRVDLVRLGRLGGVVAKQSETCPPAGWQGAVAQLAKMLQAQRGAAVSIVLSCHFAHYVVVPWSEAVSEADELLALAQHRCSQVYGAMAANWEVRLSPAGYGVPMLACGVERGLLEAIRQTCSEAGVRLESIQPSLMAAFNRWRGQVKNDGWFVLAEAGRLTLALLHGGGWHTVLSRHAAGSLTETLPAMLEQEKLLAGLPDVPQRAWLFAPEQPTFVSTAVGNWNLRLLKLPSQKGYSPVSDGNYGLAMSGGG